MKYAMAQIILGHLAQHELAATSSREHNAVREQQH